MDELFLKLLLGGGGGVGGRRSGNPLPGSLLNRSWAAGSPLKPVITTPNSGGGGARESRAAFRGGLFLISTASLRPPLPPAQGMDSPRQPPWSPLLLALLLLLPSGRGQGKSQVAGLWGGKAAQKPGLWMRRAARGSRNRERVEISGRGVCGAPPPAKPVCAFPAKDAAPPHRACKTPSRRRRAAKRGEIFPPAAL